MSALEPNADRSESISKNMKGWETSLAIPITLTAIGFPACTVKPLYPKTIHLSNILAGEGRAKARLGGGNEPPLASRRRAPKDFGRSPCRSYSRVPAEGYQPTAKYKAEADYLYEQDARETAPFQKPA